MFELVTFLAYQKAWLMLRIRLLLCRCIYLSLRSVGYMHAYIYTPYYKIHKHWCSSELLASWCSMAPRSCSNKSAGSFSVIWKFQLLSATLIFHVPGSLKDVGCRSFKCVCTVQQMCLVLIWRLIIEILPKDLCNHQIWNQCSLGCEQITHWTKCHATYWNLVVKFYLHIVLLEFLLKSFWCFFAYIYLL